jgi:hypothetical protein
MKLKQIEIVERERRKYTTEIRREKGNFGKLKRERKKESE